MRNQLMKFLKVGNLSYFLSIRNYSCCKSFRFINRSFSSIPSGNEIIAEVNEQIKNHSHGRLFAIVKFGDEQFKVTEEDIIIVQGSYPFKVGDKIRLEKILCVGSSDFTLFGTPVLPKEKVAVNATVIEKTFSNVDVDFFFVRRKDIRRLNFYRTPLSMLRVNSIEFTSPVGECTSNIAKKKPSDI